MQFKIILKNNEPVYFSIYNYHYQDPDLKLQFDTDLINLIVLYKKEESGYRLINVLIENLKDYFLTKLPTTDLYETNKVLLLGGSRPPTLEETQEYLTREKKRIQEFIPKQILDF